MIEYIALLRGINVGGHRVKMDRLREIVRGLGLEDVWTYIASGNVGFRSAERDRRALAKRLEDHLHESLGFEAATFLRSPDDLERTLAVDPPFRPAWDVGQASHFVVFLDDPPSPALSAAFAGIESDTDRFVIDGTEVHWGTSGTMSQSPLFSGGFERATRDVRTTTRNATSLRKLLAKAASERERRG